MANSCQFCNLTNGVEFAHIVYQTELLCCFLDHDPIHEGHILIVPKKHILDIEELDEATRLEIMNTAALLSTALKKKYTPDGISIMQNGGFFNEVNHYHMHVFPRYKQDGFAWVDPPFPQKQHNSASEVVAGLKKLLEPLA